MVKRRTHGKKTITRRVKRPSYKSMYAEERDNARDLAQEVIDLRAELKKAIVGKPFEWKTRDNGYIVPEAMTEEHLRNTISFLARFLIASLANASFLGTLDYKVEALNAMLKEAKRRNIRV